MKARAIPLAAACLLAITSRTAAQDVDVEAEWLRGLDGLYVIVQEPNDQEQEGGLTREALQTYLEMRLRQARIPVLSETEWEESERKPYLYLNIRALPVSGGWTYSIGLEVKQLACIEGVMETEKEGRLALCSLLTTWDAGALYTTPDNLADSVRRNLVEPMDQLVNDYLAVHP